MVDTTRDALDSHSFALSKFVVDDDDVDDFVTNEDDGDAGTGVAEASIVMVLDAIMVQLQ